MPRFGLRQRVAKPPLTKRVLGLLSPSPLVEADNRCAAAAPRPAGPGSGVNGRVNGTAPDTTGLSTAVTSSAARTSAERERAASDRECAGGNWWAAPVSCNRYYGGRIRQHAHTVPSNQLVERRVARPRCIMYALLIVRRHTGLPRPAAMSAGLPMIRTGDPGMVVQHPRWVRTPVRPW